MKNGEDKIQKLTGAQIVDLLGKDLIGKLVDIGSRQDGSVYLAGGTVRDLLLGRKPADIDLTVPDHAKKMGFGVGPSDWGSVCSTGKG